MNSLYQDISHSKKLCLLYTSPNVIRVIKSRRMRWAGHVARPVERRDVYRILVGSPKGRDHAEELRVDGRIILELI
jgi:hypothetical protein